MLICTKIGSGFKCRCKNVTIGMGSQMSGTKCNDMEVSCDTKCTVGFITGSIVILVAVSTGKCFRIICNTMIL